jgi:hypothetical protein
MPGSSLSKGVFPAKLGRLKKKYPRAQRPLPSPRSATPRALRIEKILEKKCFVIAIDSARQNFADVRGKKVDALRLHHEIFPRFPGNEVPFLSEREGVLDAFISSRGATGAPFHPHGESARPASKRLEHLESDRQLQLAAHP